MKSNSKQYYIHQKKKSILYWEKQRNNKAKFAFKNAIIDALCYGLGLFIILHGLPKLNTLYKYSIVFGVFFILFFGVHYFITFKLKEKYYWKSKKELNL